MLKSCFVGIGVADGHASRSGRPRGSCDAAAGGHAGFAVQDLHPEGSSARSIWGANPEKAFGAACSSVLRSVLERGALATSPRACWRGGAACWSAAEPSLERRVPSKLTTSSMLPLALNNTTCAQEAASSLTMAAPSCSKTVCLSLLWGCAGRGAARGQACRIAGASRRRVAEAPK